MPPDQDQKFEYFINFLLNYRRNGEDQNGLPMPKIGYNYFKSEYENSFKSTIGQKIASLCNAQDIYDKNHFLEGELGDEKNIKAFFKKITYIQDKILQPRDKRFNRVINFINRALNTFDKDKDNIILGFNTIIPAANNLDSTIDFHYSQESQEINRSSCLRNLYKKISRWF